MQRVSPKEKLFHGIQSEKHGQAIFKDLQSSIRKTENAKGRRHQLNKRRIH